MALASDRFSIREYTSKMRSVDVLKCWPFGETKKKERAEAFLPPITVQKFKWWGDELENKAAESAGGLRCPVPVKAVNAHVDKCLSQSSGKEQIRTMKARSRVPKKRSIVEIFAVAPQVDKVYYEDEDEYEDDGESVGVCSTQEDEFHDVKLLSLIHVGLNEKRKRKMKLKEGSLAIVDKLKKLKKVEKNGKRKERNGASIDLSSPKKENSLKLKKEHPLKCCSSPHTVGLMKNLLDAIPVHRKKTRPECFMTKRKTNTFGTSKLTLEQKKSVLSVRGIMKNHSKVAAGNKLTSGILRESSEAKWCDIQQSDRCVRFSGKDDILGQRIKSVPLAEFPKLQNIFCYSKAGAASLEMDRFAERGKSFFTAEVNGSDKSSSTSKEYENGVQSITEKKSSDMCLCVGKPNFQRPHISQEHLSNRTVTSNQVAYTSENLHWLEHGYRVGSHDPLSASPSGFLSLEKKAYRPNLITQGGESMSAASDNNGKVIAHNRDPSPRISAMCYSEYVNAFSQPSSSYFTNNNGNGYGRLLYPAEETSENYNGHTLQYHPFRYLTPKELMRSICSLPDLDKRGVMHVERSMNEDFVGLPLNSQGEVTQLNSSDKDGFNQLMRPCTVADSYRTLARELPSNPGNYLSSQNCDERAPSENQFQLFSVQDRVKENPDFIVPSRLDITELQGAGRSDVPFLEFLKGSSQSDYHLELGLDLMNIPSHENKQCEQIWDHSGKRKIHQERNPDLISLNVTQPTMRLMGQEFSVGKNYRNLHDNEKVWMDKQIIAEHRPANASSNRSRHLQPDFIMQPVSGKGKEIKCSSEIEISLASQSIFEIKPSESRFSQPYVSCQTSAAYENACGAFSRFPITSSYPCYPSDAYPALLSKEPMFQEPFVCEPLPINPLPMRSSSPHDTFENFTLNYTQSNKQQKKPYPTSSDFKFPFLRPDLGEPVGPSCCQSSFKSLPQWLLNATQAKETTIGSFRSYSDAVGNCHPCTVSSNNYQKMPSVCCTPDASYMYNPLSIRFPLQNAPALASITQSPLVPVCHRFSQTSTMNNRREYRMKFKEKMRAKLCVKDPFQGKRTKKKPAAKSDNFANPTKLHNLEISEDSSHGVTDLKAIGVTGVDLQGRREEFGLDLAKNVANNMECGQNETQMDASKAFTEIDTLKVNGIARPGPLKLTAGVKHILKPSESMCQSNSKPTHSKIPFAVVTSSDIVSGSDQIKPAKIYRF